MTDSNTAPGADVRARNGERSEGILDKMRSSATEQLTNQKNRATDGLGSVAQAVRQSGEQLRSGQHDAIARFTDQAADQIDRFSQHLRNKDVGDLLNDMQNVAKREPALFVGGAFALGLLTARFFKSSARSHEREWRGPSSYRPTTASAMGSRTGANSGQEVRGYAQAAGSTSAPDLSRVHDYGSTLSIATGGSLGNTESPGDQTNTGASATDATERATSTRSRSRRTTPPERS